MSAQDCAGDFECNDVDNNRRNYSNIDLPFIVPK